MKKRPAASALSIGAATHVGRVRTGNEDSFIAEPLIIGVADGMGGHQAGEVAMFVEVYDSGLVFDQKDIERIIRTNVWMSKGDGKKPWRSADGSTGASRGGIFEDSDRWRKHSRMHRRMVLHRNARKDQNTVGADPLTHLDNRGSVRHNRPHRRKGSHRHNQYW